MLRIGSLNTINNHQKQNKKVSFGMQPCFGYEAIARAAQRVQLTPSEKLARPKNMSTIRRVIGTIKQICGEPLNLGRCGTTEANTPPIRDGLGQRLMTYLRQDIRNGLEEKNPRRDCTDDADMFIAEQVAYVAGNGNNAQTKAHVMGKLEQTGMGDLEKHPDPVDGDSLLQHFIS